MKRWAKKPLMGRAYDRVRIRKWLRACERAFVDRGLPGWVEGGCRLKSRSIWKYSQ